MKRLFLALSLVALAACGGPQEIQWADPKPDPFAAPRPPAAGGIPKPAQLPANAPRTAIPEQQSRLSLLGDTSIVKARHVVGFTDRHREFWTVDDGFVRYDRLNVGAFDPRENNYTALRRLIEGTEIAETGLRYDDADVKTVQRSLGALSYVLAASATRRCFVFAHIAANQELVGSRCLAAGHPDMFNLEFKMLDLIGRIRLDGGVISRGKPLG
ncbi:MAG: hypothetical protein FJX47_02190 [Alphaproteobacteria bacterium]|nr:hypothetical protein [Alphaproteobacteria bacterium]